MSIATPTVVSFEARTVHHYFSSDSVFTGIKVGQRHFFGFLRLSAIDDEDRISVDQEAILQHLSNN
jgi:hypothetical protein